MKFCEIIIQPTAAFGTPFKGDTIFGHFCWQAAENEVLNGGLDKWIDCYQKTPFALFSSAFSRITKNGKIFYALPRPSLPTSISMGLTGNERYKLLSGRKKDKKKKYLLVGEDLQPVFSADNYCSDEDLFKLHLESLSSDQQKEVRLLTSRKQKLTVKFEQAHNTINRNTMTTGTGQFAPFSSVNTHYQPYANLTVICMYNDEATDIDKINIAFVNMGRWGFGRDASAGLGRFQVVEVRELNRPKKIKNAFYTLAPCVPKKNSFQIGYYTPFTRFGKHGAALVHAGQPFKNPVVMADEGAIFIPTDKEDLNMPYFGSAATNLSKADKRTVMQGYAICLPCEGEEKT